MTATVALNRPDAALPDAAVHERGALGLAQWRAIADRPGVCTETVNQCLAAAEAKRQLNAFIITTPERARAAAAESDERLRQGQRRRLEGAVIAVKDNFCTRDIQTTAGSRILEGFIPKYESTVTKNLLENGAVVIGKTNMDEFGMGSSTENSAFGPSLNPRGLALGRADVAPGGSSGGSAAAVAANLCLAALATDTGGSIRQPASFCGVVGFKPTYGVCSRWGIVAYASSLDQAGVIARSVEDAAIVMDAIAGHDPMDSTSLEGPAPAFEASLDSVGPGFTVGIPRQFRELEINSDLTALWTATEQAITAAGGTVRLVDMPTIRYALPTYYIIAFSEASSNLARYDGVRFGYRSPNGRSLDELYAHTRAEGFQTETKRRIITGTYCLSSGYYDAYYLKAQKVRRKIFDEFSSVFGEVDFLCWPAAPTPAFSFGAHAADPLSMYLEDVFTISINLAGLPAVSIPVFTAANGLPMGTQIIGRRLGDTGVLSVAKRIMRASGR